MCIDDAIVRAVRFCYWEKDYNCARTTLHTLSSLVALEIPPLLWAAAVGMHGAGRFGAQCGLVEGMLMFIGIQGARQGLEEAKLVTLCHAYAQAFTEHFGSLACRELRPGGFREDDPPHACGGLTLKAVRFAVNFMQEHPELGFEVKTA